VSGFECRGNGVERQGGLEEIEAIGQIIGGRVGVAERWQLEIVFDESQDAAEVVGDVRDVSGLGKVKRRSWEHASRKRNRSPADAVVDDPGAT